MNLKVKGGIKERVIVSGRKGIRLTREIWEEV